MGIVQILYIYRANSVQLLSKYCKTIVQILYKMLCEYCTKYCANIVQNIVQILFKYCENIKKKLAITMQILYK